MTLLSIQRTFYRTPGTLRKRPTRANREMRGRADARTLMRGAMLLCALVSMASCVHTATGYEECEATLHRERVAWQLERGRLASELKALRETLDSERAERLTASMRTANARERDDPADRHGTSNTRDASALVLPLRTLRLLHCKRRLRSRML